MNEVKNYYSKNGKYLKDHQNYFSDKILKRDLEFIIKFLNLTKKDKCLDLQCADGRLTIALNSKGYNVDGLDFSQYMINLATKKTKTKDLNINYYIQDINNIRLNKKYDKIFLFFPDWTDINLKKVLLNINKILKKDGLFLYDHDNLFRIWNYLEKNPNQKKKFTFDPKEMTLKEKGDKRGDRYYTFLELKILFTKFHFKILKIYGDWDINNKEYNYNSPRIRILAKKI